MGSLVPGVAQESMTAGTIQAALESLSPAPLGAAVPTALGCPRFSSKLLPSLPTPFLLGSVLQQALSPGSSVVAVTAGSGHRGSGCAQIASSVPAPSISGDPGAARGGALGGCRGERRKTDRIKITELAGPREGRPAR